jgi:hypothetical protein
MRSQFLLQLTQLITSSSVAVAVADLAVVVQVE